jgi:hypothetical protein
VCQHFRFWKTSHISEIVTAGTTFEEYGLQNPDQEALEKRPSLLHAHSFTPIPTHNQRLTIQQASPSDLFSLYTGNIP